MASSTHAVNTAPQPPTNNRQTCNRVLMIRPTALGDVSRTVPALVTLRQAMPDAKIDWLVHDAFADVIRHHPALDNVVAFPRKRFAAFYYNLRVTAEAMRWAGQLRAQRYDMVFDLQGLFRSGLFARLTAAPVRVGFANARELAWLGYNRRHWVDPRTHTVDRMLKLVEAEGYSPSCDGRLYVGPEDDRWLDGWLGEHGGAGPYACIAPTARWLCKCWPIENYTRIARQLLESGPAGDRIVIIAAPHERPQIQPLLSALGDRRHVLFPQTTVGQMMALLSRARLLICNDSAPLHIAVGFDCPIVAIFGPTDPALVGPYRRDDAVVRPPGAETADPVHYRRHRDDQSLIAQVSTKTVWEKTMEQISRVSDSASAGCELL